MAELMKTIRRTLGRATSGIHAGNEKLTLNREGSAGTLHVESSSFVAGGAIGDAFTPQGANRSPALSWSGVPAGARELVLIVEDADAPFRSPFVHWILHRLKPTVTALPEGVPTTADLFDPAAVQGTNGAKTVGYYGPQPPLGHGVHHYHFQLFAIDIELQKGHEASVDDLAEMMQGHVLADGEVVGTYEMVS